MSERARVRLAAAILVIAGLAAYADSLRGPFVFDDQGAIVGNPTLRTLRTALFPPRGGGQTVEGRPVLNLSLAINHAIGGDAVWGYHALNLFIHVMAGLALFGLVRRTLGRAGEVAASAEGGPSVVADASPDKPCPPRRGRSRALQGMMRLSPFGKGTEGAARRSPAQPDEGGPLLTAFAVALLWTVHPLQTEAVTYVIQRAESLMGLFYLLTLYCFVRGSAFAGASADEKAGSGAEPGRGERRRRGWLWASWACCLFGMGTKEVMASAPLVVLLYDRAFVSGSFGAALRRRGAAYAALASTWILLGWLVLRSGSRAGTVAFGSGVSSWQYALTQFGAIVHYLRLSFWPSPLIIDYGTEWVTSPWQAIPQAAVVCALLAATVWALVRRPRLGFLGAAFFGILAPTSSIIPGNRQTLAEHRMYLPLAVVVVLAVLAIRRLARGRRPFLAAVSCMAAVAAFATFRRNAVYASPLSLYGDTVAHRPGNPYAHGNYGFALGEAGRIPEAVSEFREALRLKPDYADAHYNLALILERRGDPASAGEEYAAALRSNPGDDRARYNLARLKLREGKPSDAVPLFTELLRREPGFADAHTGLGEALGGLGRNREAEAEFELAVRIRPDDGRARFNLGMLLAQSGRLAEAAPQLAEALRLMPAFEEGHYKYGVLLAGMGNMAGALPEFEAAVRLEPGHAEAQLDLGNVLLALGRPADAIVHYEAALAARPGYPEALNNLNYARRLRPPAGGPRQAP